ncbi:MAG: TrkH family potassium uptake protein [Finegoldia sp.]|nr:TrkH family potassium uptake protein [Finegoldia sp.]
MNVRRIFKSTARLLEIEALILIIPLICSFIYKEPWAFKRAFILSIVILLAVSLPFEKVPMKSRKVYAKEGFIIVTLSWILIAFFGGLPLYFSGQYSSLIDTFFELASGFTTAGSSVLSDVSGLKHSIIMWKAISQAIGGMGILVFALAILPNSDKESLYLMRAESPGPKFGKLVSKLKNSAIILYKMYFAIIAGLILALILAGMSPFDAITHALETAGTGGFSIYNGSVGYYNNLAIEIIIGIGMLIFSINFSLYYLFLLNKGKNFFKSEELRWFLAIVGISTLLITLNIAPQLGFGQGLRHAFFTVSSIISTTGFTSIDYNDWPLFSHLILLLLMIIGGMAGSTAGGLKVIRVSASIKSAINELKKASNPKRVLKLKYDGKVIDDEYLLSIKNYFTMYFVIFFVLLLFVSFDLKDFMSAFSAVATTFNNVGPGIGSVGPSSSFGMLSDFNKILLSFGMIAGRLEIIPMIILFSPKTWKKI